MENGKIGVFIRQLRKERGMTQKELAAALKRDYTIVLVTHDLRQATRVGDRAAFFLDGQLVEQGAADRVLSMPRDPRTEAYLTGQSG